MTPPVSTRAGEDQEIKISALIAYHLKVDTKGLAPLEVALLWRKVQWLLDFELERSKGNEMFV